MLAVLAARARGGDDAIARARGDETFATSAVDAVRRLRRALPYDAALCRRDTADARVACAEREFLERTEAWLAWHVSFRANGDCASFCDQARTTRYARGGRAAIGFERPRRGWVAAAPRATTRATTRATRRGRRRERRGAAT